MPTTADAVAMRKNWRIVPDRRSATFYRRTAVGPPATYATGAALSDMWHRDLKVSPHPNNLAVYIVYQANLFLPKEQNTAVATTSPPLPGDQIQDSAASTIPYTGVRWTVNDVEEAGALGAWKLACVAPAIISAIAVSISIYRPSASFTSSGLRQSTVSPSLISTQSAWVQDTPTPSGNNLGKRSIPQNSTVYLSTFVADIRAQDYVTIDADNYTVKAVRPPMTLLDFQEIDVELLP